MVEKETSPEKKGKKEVREESETGKEKEEIKKESAEKPADESTGESKEEANVEEEITLDFSRVKNIFRRRKKKDEKLKQELEDVEEEVKDEEESLQEEIEQGEELIGEAKQKISEDKKRIRQLKKEEEKIGKAEKEIEEQTEEDFETALDFSKLKKWFSHLKKDEEKAPGEAGKEEKEAEELSLDLKSTARFFTQPKVYIPLLIIIAMFFAVFFRVQSAYLPVTDDWAKSTVENYFKSQLMGQINQQNPHLPQENKQILLQQKWTEYKNQNKKIINEQISLLSQQYKEVFQDDQTGHTYLLAIDPYYYLRHVQHYLENGQAGTTYIGGDYGVSDDIKLYFTGRDKEFDFSRALDWDGQRMAPIGSPSKMNLHTYFEAYLYKFVHFFNRDLPLTTLIFYIPVIISSLAVIPAFFLGRKMGGNVGGLFAGVMIAVHSAFINRTAGGFADTDAYNVFFPLLIVWIFLEAFETTNLKKKFGLTILAGFFTGLFAFAWSGWWYIFDFILGAMVIYLLYDIFIYRKEIKRGLRNYLTQTTIKNTLLIFIAFILFAGLFVTLFKDSSNFIQAPFQPIIRAKTLKTVGVVTIWPNIKTTVAELNPASLKAIINQMGGKFLFLVGCLGVLLSFIKKDRFGKTDIKYAIILLIWFISTIYMSTQGVRFTLLLVPAFSVAFGVAVGIIFNYSSKWVSKELNMNKVLVSIVLFVLLCLLFIKPMKMAQATAQQEIPSMNDAWHTALTNIKTNSSQDAIINSWWDFGHWFITLADRRVTFDGGGQDKHMAHWVGKSLLTNTEEKTIGILRMVDCGNNNAFWALNSLINDTVTSIDVLNEIIVLDKEEATTTLAQYIPQEKIDYVLQYTHCQPPENYYITSDDMVGKAGVWAHFGSWDFKRALIYHTLKKKAYKNNQAKSVEFLKNKFNYSQQKAENLFYEVQSIGSNKEANSWIAPWPSYRGQSNCQETKEGIFECNNVRVNWHNLTATLTTQQGWVKPASLVYPTAQGVEEKKFDSDVPYSVIFIKKRNSAQVVLSDPALAASTFTKLYFFEGHGSKFFDLSDLQTAPTGTRIYVWQVDWQGLGKYLNPAFLPLKEVEIEHLLLCHNESVMPCPLNLTKQQAQEQAEEILEELPQYNYSFQDYKQEHNQSVIYEYLGFISQESPLDPHFLEAALSLSAQEISSIVETQFGFHLIKALSLKGDENKGNITAELQVGDVNIS